MALQENIGRDGFGNLIKQKYVTETGAGIYELIAAVADKRIKVLRLGVSALSAVVIILLSGTDNIMRFDFTAENLFANLVQTDGICVCVTDVGEALQASLGGIVTASFYIQYALVD